MEDGIGEYGEAMGFGCPDVGCLLGRRAIGVDDAYAAKDSHCSSHGGLSDSVHWGGHAGNGEVYFVYRKTDVTR